MGCYTRIIFNATSLQIVSLKIVQYDITFKPVFRHEIRRQMLVHSETLQTVIQSTRLAEFSLKTVSYS